MTLETDLREDPADEDRSEQRERGRVHPSWHVALIVISASVWIWSVVRIDQSELGGIGLITVLPIVALAALVAMLFGFTTSVWHDTRGRISAAYVLTLAVMLHGLPAFAYDYLRSSWAWKHVGIVDYIQRFDSIDTTIEALPVYHNWPGFFGVNAWVADASGLASALSYAAWAPIVFNVLFIGTLYVLFQAVTDDPRLVWTSILLFVLTNWVAQDYFAPQALAFFLYLLIVAILVRWFPLRRSERLALRPEDDIEEGTAVAAVLSVIVAVAMVAITVTHQLTPLMTLVAVSLLVVFRVIRVRWPVFLMGGLMLIWVLGPALDFVLSYVEPLLRDVGGLRQNVEGGLTDLGAVSQGQAFVSQVARLLSAAIVGVAGIGWLRLRRASTPTRWAILLAGAPIVLVVMSSYGNEVLFRAYLFALPFLAFLGGSLWFPTKKSGQGWFSRVSLLLITAVLATGLLVADYGGDQRQVFDADDFAAASYVYEHGTPASLLVDASRDYPGQFRNYEYFTYVTLDRATEKSIGKITEDPSGTLARWFRDDRYTSGFVLITGSQRSSIEQLGTLPEGMLDDIEADLLASGLFEVAFESGTSRVYVLAAP